MITRITTPWIIMVFGWLNVYTGSTDQQYDEFVEKLKNFSPSCLYSKENVKAASNFLTALSCHIPEVGDVDEEQAMKIIEEKFIAHKCAVRVRGQTGKIGYVPGYAWYFDKEDEIVQVTDLFMEPKNAMPCYTLGVNPVTVYVNGEIVPEQQGFSVQVVAAPRGDSIFDIKPEHSFLKPAIDRLQSPDFDPKDIIELIRYKVPSNYYFNRGSVYNRPTTFNMIHLGAAPWAMDDLETISKALPQMPHDMQQKIQEQIDYLGDIYDFRIILGLLSTMPCYLKDLSIIPRLACLDGGKYALELATVRTRRNFAIHPLLEAVKEKYCTR